MKEKSQIIAVYSILKEPAAGIHPFFFRHRQTNLTLIAVEAAIVLKNYAITLVTNCSERGK